MSRRHSSSLPAEMPASAISSKWRLPLSASSCVWRGRGVDEEGVCRKTGKVRVKVNPAFFRPAEVDALIGDRLARPTPARLEGSDLARRAVPADGRGRYSEKQNWLLVLSEC